MHPGVIRLDNVAKHHGRQVLFIESSMTLNPGVMVGLVGPNGAATSIMTSAR